jgi:hypothetical protein
VLWIDNNGHDSQPAVLQEGDYLFDYIYMTFFGHLKVLGVSSTLGIDSQTVIGDGTAVLTVEGRSTPRGISALTPSRSARKAICLA